MSRFRDFIRDNGDRVEVKYTTKGGSDPVIRLPWLSEPGEAPEVSVASAWLYADRDRSDAPPVTLTDAELERFDEEVCADPTIYEVDYDD